MLLSFAHDLIRRTTSIGKQYRLPFNCHPEAQVSPSRSFASLEDDSEGDTSPKDPIISVGAHYLTAPSPTGLVREFSREESHCSSNQKSKRFLLNVERIEPRVRDRRLRSRPFQGLGVYRGRGNRPPRGRDSLLVQIKQVPSWGSLCLFPQALPAAPYRPFFAILSWASKKV